MRGIEKCSSAHAATRLIPPPIYIRALDQLRNLDSDATNRDPRNHLTASSLGVNGQAVYIYDDECI